MKYSWLLICFLCFFLESQAQTDSTQVQQRGSANDSIKKTELLNYLGNGYFPTRYFNFDLRYLVKYNQYEGFRTGLGGITNNRFSERYRLQGYTVYGFLDHRFKYSIGGGVRIAPKTNTWINLSYTDDLQETGSSNFLTDKRFFQFFEPRLINIDLFHKHISKALTIEHQISPKILTEAYFSISKITPTYQYTFHTDDGKQFSNFDLSLTKLSVQWSPFSTFKRTPNGIVETRTGYPQFTAQFTKSFENVLKGDFNFSKIDFRAIQQFEHQNKSSTQLVLSAGLTDGDTPLTHLYHAYPNNVNKETILRRFSVAGVNSFETMYFNEFFSDKFATLQIKHKLKPFEISPRFKPQLVFITRYAVGDMDSPEKHEHISFKTLEKGFTESGIEINQLFFGFGLSFAYRYGAYHLPGFDDNFAFKFTFNLNLNN